MLRRGCTRARDLNVGLERLHCSRQHGSTIISTLFKVYCCTIQVRITFCSLTFLFFFFILLKLLFLKLSFVSSFHNLFIINRKISSRQTRSKSIQNNFCYRSFFICFSSLICKGWQRRKGVRNAVGIILHFKNSEKKRCVADTILFTLIYVTQNGTVCTSRGHWFVWNLPLQF